MANGRGPLAGGGRGGRIRGEDDGRRSVAVRAVYIDKEDGRAPRRGIGIELWRAAGREAGSRTLGEARRIAGQDDVPAPPLSHARMLPSVGELRGGGLGGGLLEEGGLRSGRAAP